MRYLVCTAFVLASSCVFGGTSPAPDNAETNNATTGSNNSTTASNNGTTPATNNETTPGTNNQTTPTNNATNNPTNNNTMPECRFDETLLGQLCEAANDDPVAVPLAGEVQPPPPCEAVSCGSCAAGALRGNFCLPEVRTLDDPSPEWGRALAISDRYLVVSPTAGDAMSPPEVRIYDFQLQRFWGGAWPVVPEFGQGHALAITDDYLFGSAPGRDLVEILLLDASNEAPLPGHGELPPPPEIGADGTDQWGYALAAADVDGVPTVFIGAPDVNYVNFAERGPDGPWMAAPFTSALVQTVGSGAAYGAALALDESATTLVVGAPGAGQAHVWVRGNNWDHDAVIDAPNGEPSFGASVAINANADLIAVGSPMQNNNAGGVHLYRRGPGGWELVDSFNGTAGAPAGPGARFGASIALHEQVLLVGVPGENALAAFVGTPQLGHVSAGAFSPPNTNLRRAFGRAVVAAHGRVAISATNDLANNRLSGIFIGEFGTGF